MRKTNRLLALVLTLVMTVSIFTACGDNKKNKEEEKAAITATSVKFSKDGKYTTTVKSDTVDLSKVSAKGVEIKYADPTADALTEADLKAMTSDSANEDETNDDFYSLSAKVEEVKKNDKGGYDISFTDKDAAEYAPSNYAIYLNDVEGTATALVEYPEITVTSDVDFVTPADKEIKLTLTIKGSEFEKDISKTDIAIDDAFEKMDKKVISSSANNLTLKLKGSLVKNEGGSYQWGTVVVKPSGIKDGHTDVSARVTVKTDYSGLDASSLKYMDGKITVNLLAYGVDIKSLKKDDIKIDGVSVENIKIVDDNHATLTITNDKIKNENDFADLVNGKTMKVGEYESEVVLPQANFYPIFDYVEDDGDNLKLTLKLYSFYGDFDKDISTDKFSFSDGFKGAKAESVKVDENGIATLIISVPSNGQKSDSLKINGTVTVAADAFVNAWGEKATKESAYTRDYSAESLGKDITLNKETLLEIQKFTRGKNTTFGSICYWGGVAGQVYSIGKSVLEVTGVVKSEHQQIMEQFEQLNKRIDVILENQAKTLSLLNTLTEKTQEMSLDNYKDDIDLLEDNVALMKGKLQNAAIDMALEDAVANGKLDKFPDFSGMDDDKITEELVKYKKYLPEVEDMTDKERADYGDRLVNYILKRADNKEDREFATFDDNLTALCRSLLDVCNKLSRKDGSNPLTRYDELCTMQFNFDTECNAFRVGMRETAVKLMGEALSIIGISEKAVNNPRNSNFKVYKDNVKSAADRIEALSVELGLTAEEVKANPRTEYEVVDKITPTYIGEVALAGSKDGHGQTQQILKDNGYTPTGEDMNHNAGGDWIFIGYKTTTDFNKAIKNFKVRTGLHNPESFTEKGATYHKVKGVGNSSFVGSGCDLNHNVKGSEWIYLYYTTDKVYGDNAITSLIFQSYVVANPLKPGFDFCNVNLNEGAGGDKVFIGAKFANKNDVTNVTKAVDYDKDPAYYPFSYVLGKKVAYIDSKSYTDYRKVTGAIKDTNGKYRNFTDEEETDFEKRLKRNPIILENGQKKEYTLKEDFANAGMNPPHGLLTKINCSTVDVTYSRKAGESGENHKSITFTGNIIELNSKAHTYYDSNHEIAHYADFSKSKKLVKNCYHDFVCLECYD